MCCVLFRWRRLVIAAITLFIVLIPQVSEFFGSFKGLGLGAEHGFYYRWPREESAHSSLHSDAAPHLTPITPGGSGGGKTKWQTMTELGDQTWKESAKLVMVSCTG